jgi:hypothetical protein
MSLIKTAFSLGLVVWLLPTDRESQVKLFETAATGVERARTFCVRNPETCTRAEQYWAVFKAKAQFGAEMAWSLATERARTAAPADADGKRSAPLAPAPARGTLTDRDLEPVWRGKVAGRDGG